MLRLVTSWVDIRCEYGPLYVVTCGVQTIKGSFIHHISLEHFLMPSLLTQSEITFIIKCSIIFNDNIYIYMYLVGRIAQSV